MPSFSFTSLDRLIEPARSSSSSQVNPSFDRSTPFSFYPPLYATPSHQRPPSPTGFSPSPYVLNYKRRVPLQQPQVGGRESRAEPSTEVPLQQQCHRMNGTQEKCTAVVQPAKVEEASLGELETTRKAYKAVVTENEVFDMELEKIETSADINRGFKTDNVKLCNSMSVSIDHGTREAHASHSLVAIEEAEFFDATDSVLSESASEDEVYSSMKPGRSLKEWGSQTAARLEEETARRLKAEENGVLWQRRWNEMAKRCAVTGVRLPVEVVNVLENQNDSAAEEVDQELVVARLVGAAIARAASRAEKEEELDEVLRVKNREISRLWDKLQYLELVNREMSQRNQEVTESTQRRKRRRQRRQKLALSGFCAAFCIGSVGLMGYKFFPLDQAKLWADTYLKSPAIENESM